LANAVHATRTANPAPVDVTDLAFCIDYLERWGGRNSA